MSPLHKLRRQRWEGVAAALLLASCSSAPDDPSTVTADEQRQLNKAAAQLDANAIAPAPASNESSQP